MPERDTVGKISQELIRADTQVDHTPEEQMREMLTQYDQQLLEAVQAGVSKYQKDFFIEVQTKKEPKMVNVLRNYFIPRTTCPTPTYDQVVYKVYFKDEHIEFLWNLPDKVTYHNMKHNFLDYPADQKQLIGFVLDDADGTLLKRCKQLNGEL